MSRLEFKYSKLVMSANKECELPAADSCAIMEGEAEEVEDDVVYTKPSLLGKLKAIASKVYTTRCGRHGELCIILSVCSVLLRIQLSVWTSCIRDTVLLNLVRRCSFIFFRRH